MRSGPLAGSPGEPESALAGFSPPFRGFGLAAFFVPRCACVAFDLVEDVSVLAPACDTLALAQAHGKCDDLAHGIHEQIEVGGKVCRCRLNIDPPCRSKFDPGRVADFQISNCG